MKFGENLRGVGNNSFGGLFVRDHGFKDEVGETIDEENRDDGSLGLLRRGLNQLDLVALGSVDEADD